MEKVFKSFAKIIGIVLLLAFMQNQAWAEERIYKDGDKGQEVAAIQQKLNKLGYTKMVITGVYDKKTAAAIKKFQKENNLKITGQTDEVTYQALMNAEIRMPGAQKGEKKPTQSPKDQNTKNSAVLKTASQYMGIPYRFGGSSPDGFDCSGYVMYVFEKNGKKLPRTADEQFKVGTKVEKSKLKEGDLVFFTTYEPGPSHIGIYYGGNKFIHASSSKGITISAMDEIYWKTRYLGAKRVL